MSTQLPYTYGIMIASIESFENLPAFQMSRVFLCMISAKWSSPYRKISANMPVSGNLPRVQLSGRCFYFFQSRRIIRICRFRVRPLLKVVKSRLVYVVIPFEQTQKVFFRCITDFHQANKELHAIFWSERRHRGCSCAKDLLYSSLLSNCMQ